MNVQNFTCNTATLIATLNLLQLLHLSKGALCATNATKAYRLVAVLHKDRRCKLRTRKTLRVQPYPKRTRKLLQKGLE